MKRYVNLKDDRYRFHVRECLNGFALQVLVVSTGDNVPLSEEVIGRMELSKPEGYRVQHGTREEAEAALAEMANMNGWEEVNNA